MLDRRTAFSCNCRNIAACTNASHFCATLFLYLWAVLPLWNGCQNLLDDLKVFAVVHNIELFQCDAIFVECLRRKRHEEHSTVCPPRRWLGTEIKHISNTMGELLGIKEEPLDKFRA